MFTNEIKEYKKDLYNSIKNIDSELVKIKVAIHNLEKLGYNVDNFNKLIDSNGITFYQLKNKINDFIKIQH